MTDPTPHIDRFSGTQILRDAMRTTGYTQAQMARYIGVPLPTFNNWLAERRETPYMAQRILEILGIIRVMAPDLHTQFAPPAAMPDKRRRENWSESRQATLERRKMMMQPGVRPRRPHAAVLPRD